MKPNPWTKFQELLDALAAEGTLQRKATVQALEQFASSFTENTDRDMYRGELGVSLARAGELGLAANLIDGMENLHEKANHWRKLAEQQFKNDDTQSAFSFLRRVEQAADSLGPNCFWQRAEILSMNAKLLEDFNLSREARNAWDGAISIAKAGQVADPNSSDCSAVLVNVARLLAELGRMEFAKSVADSITIPARRNFANELIERASFQK